MGEKRDRHVEQAIVVIRQQCDKNSQPTMTNSVARWNDCKYVLTRKMLNIEKVSCGSFVLSMEM